MGEGLLKREKHRRTCEFLTNDKSRIKRTKCSDKDETEKHCVAEVLIVSQPA